MIYKRAIRVLLPLLLLSLVGSVQASSVFVIRPSKEATQNVECPSGCQSFAGNVSAVGGTIDFYVSDPSGNVVLHYENIAFVEFSVDTPQNGTYVIHMRAHPDENISFAEFSVDTPQDGTYLIHMGALLRHLADQFSTNNVTATLSVNRNFKIDVSSKVTFFSTATSTISFSSIAPPWWTTVVQIIPRILEQLPKLHELTEKIKPPEYPPPPEYRPLFPDPTQIVLATILVSLAFVADASSGLRSKNLRQLGIQPNLKLGILRERKRIRKERTLAKQRER